MALTVGLWCVVLLFAAAIFAFAAWRASYAGSVIYGTCFAASAAGLAAAFVQLTGNAAVPELTLPLGLPWLGAHFRIDSLSAFFLVVVNLGGAAASAYGIGYGRHESSPDRVLPFFPAFLAGMNLVVMADDAFTFLLSWEFMSLASWALVMAHHREADNARAGYVYFVMASLGTIALLLAFGLLAGPEGTYGFAAIRAGEHAPLAVALALGLVLLGAGSKAGLVPLHAWLPLAHPAAPSHVSALMSGVMTKVAIYAAIRIVFDLVGNAQWWWGGIMLAIGGITATMGILYALLEHDLKRLLAYSTVENVGIVFIGLGLALAFRANGLIPAAALALGAALFHAFNHSIFKSLLFFGAGAVHTTTGERDMERLGGLIRFMPQTALAFLAGSAAISALPPLNGFASEWLILQAILLSPDLPQWTLKFLVPAVGALLVLSAALVASCFVKAFGITFLGRSRSPSVPQARETDVLSRAVMFALAGLCLVAGVVPGAIIGALNPAVQELAGAALPAGAAARWIVLVPFAASQVSYSGPVVLGLAIFATAFAYFLVRLVGSSRLRRAPAWDCGFPDRSPATQYTADSFAEPIRRVFGTVLFDARERVEMPAPGDIGPARFELHTRDYAWDFLYAPVATAVSYAADKLNRVQFLSIRRYLTMVFGALIFLLSVVALWR
jgi:formate hydrogenlyase subunit 3/multisubunit Na+/H+ antiporter MnhD subunit